MEEIRTDGTKTLYTYDIMDRVTETANYEGEECVVKYNYIYDAAGRVIFETISEQNAAAALGRAVGVLAAMTLTEPSSRELSDKTRFMRITENNILRKRI